MNKVKLKLECYCGYTRWQFGNILGDCPKCGRDGSKQEIVDEIYFDDLYTHATATMMEEGVIDKYKG